MIIAQIQRQFLAKPVYQKKNDYYELVKNR
jgi:hypothetical protein